MSAKSCFMGRNKGLKVLVIMLPSKPTASLFALIRDLLGIDLPY